MAGGHQLWIDTETFSMIPLKRGHHAYFDSTALPEIMIAAWAVDDGRVAVEDLTEIERSGAVTTFFPSRELEHWLHDADEVVIHNSAFDRRAMAACWGIDLAVERVHDTMVQAMTHSLPGSLGKLCEIMGVDEDEAKAENGQALIRLFCMPLPKNQKLRRATKATHPEKWREFLSYAGRDITSMRALYDKLPIWNYRNTNQHKERSLWHLDQRINERGFRVDMDMTRAAIATIGREQKRLKIETQELTNGEVEKATKRDDLLVHIFVEYGIYLPDLKKDTLERRLEDPEIPDALKQLLRVRLATTTTSTAKYTALTRVSVQEAEDVHVDRKSVV